MGRCKNCCHWVPGHSLGLPDPFGYRVCKLAHGYDGEPQEKGTMAFAWAPGDFDSAFLRTHPNFGCVQWEANPRSK